jgi:hypothetical protein
LRDVERVIAQIESRWRAVLEGCRGWGRWLATGGGRLGIGDDLVFAEGSTRTRFDRGSEHGGS